MPAYLFVQKGRNSGEIHVLGEGTVVVGRGEECGIRLGDATVSRRHFRIERAGDAYILVDLGSRNCTLVNGLPALASLIFPPVLSWSGRTTSFGRPFPAS